MAAEGAEGAAARVDEAQADLKRAQADLEQVRADQAWAEARVDWAQARVDRAEARVDGDPTNTGFQQAYNLSQADLEQVRADLRWAQARVAVAQQACVDAQAHLWQARASPDEDPRRKRQRMEDEVDQIFEAWLMERKEFFAIDFKFPMRDNFGGLRCKYTLPILRDKEGERPSFLVHALETQITNVAELLAAIDRGIDNVFPILGVSGSGKTRMMYELLSNRYGMLFVGCQEKNGGSRDMSWIKHNDYGLGPKRNTERARQLTQAVMLARLLIFRHCKDSRPSQFTPLMWLLMQVYFKQFVNYDPFQELSLRISKCHDVAVKISTMWDSDLIWVLDEAQVLGKGLKQFLSQDNGSERTVFSPLFYTLLMPSSAISGHPVVISGTGLGFLKLEEAIFSKMVPAKELTRDKWFWTNLHTRWTKESIREFVNKTISVGDDVVEYLVEWFVGRRRPLVTAIERLVSLDQPPMCEVTELVRLMTQEQFAGSFYKTVFDLHTGEKQMRFCMRNGGVVDVSELIKIISVLRLTAYQGRVLGTEKGDALIVEYGLGLITLLDESELSFSIDEPLVLEAITQYGLKNDLVNRYLKQMMAYTAHEPSTAGRYWEKYACHDLDNWFSTPRKLSDCPCFMDVPSCWKDEEVRIDGSDYITLEKSTSIYDFTSGKTREKFFLFDDLSAPDVMFFLKTTQRRIPVFCQFKLRKKLSSTEAEKAAKTTQVGKMYAHDQEKKKALQDICADGYISLVICFPAKVTKKKQLCSSSKRLMGYLQEEHIKVMMEKSHDFLCVLKDVTLDAPSNSLKLA